jgi:hypothetical protein
MAKEGEHEIRDVLARLEAGAPVGVQEVASALAKRWPKGVIVAVLESDWLSEQTAMAFGWRGDYFAGLGMLQQLQQVMLTQRDQYAGDLTTRNPQRREER